MNTLNYNYRRPFLFALGLHVLLLIILIIHIEYSPTLAVSQPSTTVIKATVISQNQVEQVQLQQQQQIQQQAQQAQLAQQQLAQQQQQQQELKAQQAQQVQQAQIHQQQIAQQQARIALKQKQEKLAAQKKLIIEEFQQQLAEQQQQDQHKQQAAIKQKELQAAKLATQQLLQQEISTNDSAPSSATSNNANPKILDKYKSLIIQAISQQWIVPQDVQKEDQMGKLLVRIAPGGVVLSVQIVQSSGNLALDHSAQVAVFKASPLPVPSDPSLFEQFREINLAVKPDGIQTNG